MLGKQCGRELWLSFRWARNPRHPGRLLRLFQRGHDEETKVIAELRAIGLEVWELDENGNQFRVEWLGGHIGGGCDGVAKRVPGAKKTPHVTEIKSSNEKRFDQLTKDGVEKAQPQHFIQMQVYMKGLKLTRALYVCVCKNDDRIYTERVHFDEEKASAALLRASNIVSRSKPMPRISEDPSWWQCKFCDYQSVCQDTDYQELERNCRTCASSTPKMDGSWFCEFHGCLIDSSAQREGCGSHLFNPTILDRWEVGGVDQDERSIHYQTPTGVVTDNGKNLKQS